MDDIQLSIYEMLKRFDSLTAKDKKLIRKMAKENDIPVIFKNTQCGECHKDALLLLKAKYNVNAPSISGVTDSGNYIYLKDETHYWMGRVPLNTSTPDSVIEKVMALHKGFFKINNIDNDKRNLD